jgi:prepilin-type N-terminal cleavage/methylation domain-containing protein
MKKRSLKMTKVLKGSKGISLIELMVALVISAILIAGLYRTFIGQQKTYTVQEQVVDMQQNARVAISKVIRDIRMAGFGNVATVLPSMGQANAFTMNGDNITVIGAYRQLRDDDTKELITVAETAGNTITLSHPTNEFDNYDYICIGGLYSYIIQGAKPRGEVTVLTLDRKPEDPKGAYVYKIVAITHSLTASLADFADTIESVQFTYMDENGNPTGTPANVRMVRLAVTAKTKDADPDFKGVGGYRRRVMTSNIQMRNIGLSP